MFYESLSYHLKIKRKEALQENFEIGYSSYSLGKNYAYCLLTLTSSKVSFSLSKHLKDEQSIVNIIKPITAALSSGESNGKPDSKATHQVLYP